MASKEKYKIVVGERSLNPVTVGNISKNRDRITEKVAEMQIPSPSKLISNYFPVWGKRIIRDKNGNIDQTKYEVKVSDPDYNGEIQFMNWGAEGGEEIFVRHLSGTKSIDAQFQELRLNMKPKDVALIVLEAGQNEFDERSQGSLIQILKVHYKNKDSKSANRSQFKTWCFYEVDGLTKSKDTKKLEEAASSSLLVMSLDMKPANLKVLFNLMGAQKTMPEVNDPNIETQVYPALLKYANEHPDSFNAKVENYKREMSDAFEKAEAFRVLDLTLNGTISLSKDGRKMKIIEDIPSKGDSMKSWCLANFHEPKVYEGINNLINNIQKLK